MNARLGISAETGYGDIALAVVGASAATVKTGGGRIDAVGLRGGLLASASSGEIFIRAVPHDDCQLSSISGTVRLQLPHGSGFDLDLATNSGEMLITRSDLKNPNAGVRHTNQKANHGGKRIEVRTESRRIVVSLSVHHDIEKVCIRSSHGIQLAELPVPTRFRSNPQNVLSQSWIGTNSLMTIRRSPEKLAWGF